MSAYSIASTASPGSELLGSLDEVFAHIKHVLSAPPSNALPAPSAVRSAHDALQTALPTHGMALPELTKHLLILASSGLSNSSLSSTYYGFVTGGVTHPARIGELLTALYDQNVTAHLPAQSIATALEDRACGPLLMGLLGFDEAQWPSRVFTTGATASNMQGLLCARESIINRRLRKGPGEMNSVGELGLLEACRQAGIDEIKVLTTRCHSSLAKAASVAGLGRAACIDVRQISSEMHEEDLNFDFELLERELRVERRACIVAVSCGEVNTGSFATSSLQDMERIRSLCDQYSAWLHIDGAFGIFTRLLQDQGLEWQYAARGGIGIELADSVAGDLHKLLNVPYDCGFFWCRERHIQREVYQNPNAAYLSAGALDLPSPLNIRAENSTRFRGLAVYGGLIGLGKAGYVHMLKTQIQLARKIAEFVNGHAGYELLNGRLGTDLSAIFMIVLFKAKNPSLNERLAEAINSHLKLYVSGTKWKGEPAVRIAISNWQAKPSDLETVATVLDSVWASVQG